MSRIAEDGKPHWSAMEQVNCSGLPFHAALQASVAQGLVNRAGGRVWLTDLAEGLGEAGQQACAIVSSVHRP